MLMSRGKGAATPFRGSMRVSRSGFAIVRTTSEIRYGGQRIANHTHAPRKHLIVTQAEHDRGIPLGVSRPDCGRRTNKVFWG